MASWKRWWDGRVGCAAPGRWWLFAAALVGVLVLAIEAAARAGGGLRGVKIQQTVFLGQFVVIFSRQAQARFRLRRQLFLDPGRNAGHQVSRCHGLSFHDHRACGHHGTAPHRGTGKHRGIDPHQA